MQGVLVPPVYKNRLPLYALHCHSDLFVGANSRNVSCYNACFHAIEAKVVKSKLEPQEQRL